MSFRQNAWAKCWSIEPGERSTKVRISTSRKNKQTGEYEQDFSGFVTLAATAHQDAAQLSVGDTFQIGECEVTSRYDKEKQKNYTNFLIYSIHIDDKERPATKASAAVATMDDPDEADLPF